MLNIPHLNFKSFFKLFGGAYFCANFRSLYSNKMSSFFIPRFLHSFSSFFRMMSSCKRLSNFFKMLSLFGALYFFVFQHTFPVFRSLPTFFSCIRKTFLALFGEFPVFSRIAHFFYSFGGMFNEKIFSTIGSVISVIWIGGLKVGYKFYFRFLSIFFRGTNLNNFHGKVFRSIFFYGRLHRINFFRPSKGRTFMFGPPVANRRSSYSYIKLPINFVCYLVNIHNSVGRNICVYPK